MCAAMRRTWKLAFSAKTFLSSFALVTWLDTRHFFTSSFLLAIEQGHWAGRRCYMKFCQNLHKPNQHALRWWRPLRRILRNFLTPGHLYALRLVVVQFYSFQPNIAKYDIRRDFLYSSYFSVEQIAKLKPLYLFEQLQQLCWRPDLLSCVLFIFVLWCKYKYRYKYKYIIMMMND